MRLAGLVVALAAALALAGSGGAGVPVPPTPGDGLPTWSPDGSVIVFLSSRAGAALRVVNPDGTGEQQLPWLASDGTYSFSPDWSHIAFQDAHNHMIVERLDGSDRVDLGQAVYFSIRTPRRVVGGFRTRTQSVAMLTAWATAYRLWATGG